MKWPKLISQLKSKPTGRITRSSFTKEMSRAKSSLNSISLVPSLNLSAKQLSKRRASRNNTFRISNWIEDYLWRRHKRNLLKLGSVELSKVSQELEEHDKKQRKILPPWQSLSSKIEWTNSWARCFSTGLRRSPANSSELETFTRTWSYLDLRPILAISKAFSTITSKKSQDHFINKSRTQIRMRPCKSSKTRSFSTITSYISQWKMARWKSHTSPLRPS